jgi:hypothetical protein
MNEPNDRAKLEEEIREEVFSEVDRVLRRARGEAHALRTLTDGWDDEARKAYQQWRELREAYTEEAAAGDDRWSDEIGRELQFTVRLVGELDAAHQRTVQRIYQEARQDLVRSRVRWRQRVALATASSTSVPAQDANTTH